MAKTLTTATTYEELSAFVGDRSARKVAHNTTAERLPDSIGIRLHATVVVEFHRDGSISLNSGGWRTATTKDRMCSFLPLPLRVGSTDGVWSLVRVGHNPGFVSEFYDRMRFTPDGAMVTETLTDSGREMKRIKREIRSYVNTYTDEKASDLVNRAAENGTSGDCLFCQLALTDDPGHLFLHIEEGYQMATLMVNALRYCGYGDVQIPVVVRYGDIVRRSLRRYLTGLLTSSHGARPTVNPNPGHWA